MNIWQQIALSLPFYVDFKYNLSSSSPSAPQGALILKEDQREIAAAGSHSSIYINFFLLCAHIQTKAELNQTTIRPQTTARLQFTKLQLPAVRRMFVSLDTVQSRVERERERQGFRFKPVETKHLSQMCSQHIQIT